MYRETFTPNPIWLMVTLMMFIIVLVIFFRVMMMKPIFILPFPAWLLLFLFLPLIFRLINGQTIRLIIEGDTLRLERGIFPRQEDEVSLLEVAEFTAKSDWGANHNTHTRIIHIMDKKGNLILAIPGYLIGFRNIKRFKAAVLAVNPNIKID